MGECVEAMPGFVDKAYLTVALGAYIMGVPPLLPARSVPVDRDDYASSYFWQFAQSSQSGARTSLWILDPFCNEVQILKQVKNQDHEAIIYIMIIIINNYTNCEALF